MLDCVVSYQAPNNLVKYSLVGNTTATQYFMVDADTGHVSLKKSLALDADKTLQYTVCMPTEIDCSVQYLHVYISSIFFF